ncbi:hypothetical protein STANM309S_01295 [Streptomyces tanashiensis]
MVEFGEEGVGARQAQFGEEGGGPVVGAAVEAYGRVLAGGHQVVREPGRPAQDPAVGEFHPPGAGVARGDPRQRLVEQRAPQPAEHRRPGRGQFPMVGGEEPGGGIRQFAGGRGLGAGGRLGGARRGECARIVIRSGVHEGSLPCAGCPYRWTTRRGTGGRRCRE